MQATAPALPLLGLPPLQRRVIIYLTREGRADATRVAAALAADPAAVQGALTALIDQGHLWQRADGQLELRWGRTRRRTLPARLWPALQAASRLYSAQEIATLRTAVPILQFARAKLGEFTDHGPGHVLRVKTFATQLGCLLGLSAVEQHLLRAAALFHDVGNILDRDTHHIISQETVERLTANGLLPFSSREAALVGLLCRWHRKAYDPQRTDEWPDATIRTGLLASILRVADALDSDYRRVDYGEKFQRVVELFFPHEVPYGRDLATILGIRICCRPTLHLQVFVRPGTVIAESYHIRALHKDVADTPLACTIQVFHCTSGAGEQHQEPATSNQQPAALVVAPFEPHSLVMAALSQQHLLVAGYMVTLLIYPDLPDAGVWLWRDGLADFAPADFAHLLLIGDRPDPTLTDTVVAGVTHWQAAGVSTTILNRHEANWARLPALLHAGAHVTLGGDWAYFWGDQATEADLFWGRIAALCTRDPIQSTAGLTAEEETISQGFLKVVYDALAAVAEASSSAHAAWTAAASPILAQIAADDRAWFADQAASFGVTYATLAPAPQVTGKVLHFDLAATGASPALFWALEAAIEAQGRVAERSIAFKTPYAIATWVAPRADQEPGPPADAVELVAINHWREEEATPIRLLYPSDLGPAPEGNECAIRVRLPSAQAAAVVQRLIAACNAG